MGHLELGRHPLGERPTKLLHRSRALLGAPEQIRRPAAQFLGGVPRQARECRVRIDDLRLALAYPGLGLRHYHAVIRIQDHGLQHRDLLLGDFAPQDRPRLPHQSLDAVGDGLYVIEAVPEHEIHREHTPVLLDGNADQRPISPADGLLHQWVPIEIERGEVGYDPEPTSG